MELVINKNTLVNALQLITPITDKSSSKPILSNFVLRTVGEPGDEGEVELSATDYEIAVRGTFKAQVRKQGSICVSARKMLETCREFMAEEIQISDDEQLWVTVAGGPSRLRLPSVEIGLYPQMEFNDLGHKFRMSAKELRRCIDLTLFAAQSNETRKNLMGVCLHIGEDRHARWTATDGHRLAQVVREVTPEGNTGFPEIIIPRKSLVEMQKVLDAAAEEVAISFDERSLVLAANGVSLMTRLIEGTFPNVEPIIPRDNDKVLVVERERLINGLKIISFMSSEKIKPVKLSLQGGKLRLESEHVESGEAFDELDVDYSGEDFQIGFNAQYLLDVLSVARHGERVRLELKGALNPCLISVPEDASFLSVVMPLKIEW